MSVPEATNGLQAETLRCYLRLTRERSSWRSRLVLVQECGDAVCVALAAVASGAAVLWLAGSDSTLRAANQRGITHFNVQSLSESVRVLKNEIRRGRAVSVGLMNTGNDVLREAVARGLQPDAIFMAGEPTHPAVQTILARGAIDLRQLPPPESEGAVITSDLAGNWRERKTGDRRLQAAAMQLGEPERECALRWFEAAPTLFAQDRCRVYATAWSLEEKPE